MPALGFRINEVRVNDDRDRRKVARVEHPGGELEIKTQRAVDWDEYDFNLEDVLNASTGGSRHGSFDEKKWIAVIDALNR